MKKESVERAESSFVLVSEALSAFVHILCTTFVLYSLNTWLRVTELAQTTSFQVASTSLTCLLVSLLWWRPLNTSYVAYVRRMCTLCIAVVSGPVWLSVYGKTAGSPATFDFLVIVGASAFLLGPDILSIRAVFIQWMSQDSFDEKGSSTHQEVKESSLHSWLFTFVGVLGTLCLLPILLPYSGRLGAHVALASLWSVWLLPSRTEAVSIRSLRTWTRGVPSIGWATLFFLYFVYPVPNVFYGNEIIYTDFAAGQSVTLHAWSGERNSVYTLTTKKAVLYSSTTSYRQSEMFVHPAMNMRKERPKKILLLGSEDGAMLRELAKYTYDKEVVWVPLFPFWRAFFARAPLLSRELAYDARHTRVRALPALSALDEAGLQLLQEDQGVGQFDLIIADFPTYTKQNRALYSSESQKILASMLKPKGILVSHIASPYTQSSSYWCLVGQWARLGMHIVPFRLEPSMYRDVGLALISKQAMHPFEKLLKVPVKTKYLYASQPFSVLAQFAKDTAPDGRFMKGTCQ